jgi:hypothetical protein
MNTINFEVLPPTPSRLKPVLQLECDHPVMNAAIQ